jgi:hypothetical protein
MMLRPMRAALLALLVILAACSRGDPAAKHRLYAREDDRGAAQRFDPSHPEAALALDADEVARRLGAFEWAAAVEWSVAQPDGARLHVTEQHRLRQAAGGEFEVRADVDPGLGPSAVQGKQLVYTGGMTYARAVPAPFRQRPTDLGHDARRFRQDSFGLARSVAELVGPGLRLEPAGGDAVLGREALRYRAWLGPERPGPAPAPPPGYQGKDPGTAARQGFLAGRVPTAVSGELVLDGQTGAPLRVRLEAVFQAPAEGAKGPAVTVAVSAQVKALGGEVKPVSAPAGALLDERKPAGPSTALEATGLKKRGEERPSAEPADEGDQ